MRNTVRLWVIGAVMISAALIGGGYLLGAQPLLSSAQAADASVAASHVRTDALRVQLAQLAEKAQDIRSIRLKAAAASAAVPAGFDAKAFITRLNSIASQDGLTVRAITPGAPVAYTVPLSAGVPAPAASAAPTPSATPTASAGPIAPPAQPQSATDPAITSKNFVAIPITVSVAGANADVLDFVNDVQHDSRLFLVNGYNSTVDVSKKDVDGTLTGYVYALTS